MPVRQDFFFQAEDGIRDHCVMEFRRVLFRSEGDGLPSLVVDRYGPYIVAQLLSAGLEQVRADVLDGIGAALAPEGILLRNDTTRSEEHTSELQSHSDLVCRLLLEKKKTKLT